MNDAGNQIRWAGFAIAVLNVYDAMGCAGSVVVSADPAPPRPSEAQKLECWDRFALKALGMEWPECGHKWHMGVCNAPALLAELERARGVIRTVCDVVALEQDSAAVDRPLLGAREALVTAFRSYLAALAAEQRQEGG